MGVSLTPLECGCVLESPYIEARAGLIRHVFKGVHKDTGVSLRPYIKVSPGGLQCECV